MRCIAHHKEKLTIKGISRDHNLTMDMSAPLGNNEGMTPGEVLLNAIAGCKIISFMSLAKMSSLKIEDLVVEVEGEVDKDGFVEGTQIPKKAIKSIKTIYKIKTTNSKEEIENHLKLVDQLCTVGNVISDKVEKTNEIIIEN